MAGKVEKGGWPEQEVTGHLGSAFRWPRVIRSPAVKLWFQCLPQMLDFLQITQHSQPQPGTSSSIKQEACGRPFIFQLQHLQELWHAPTCDSCRWQSHWYCCTYNGRSSPQIPVQTGCGRELTVWSVSGAVQHLLLGSEECDSDLGVLEFGLGEGWQYVRSETKAIFCAFRGQDTAEPALTPIYSASVVVWISWRFPLGRVSKLQK